MAKSPDAFRTISEVASWLGTQSHVLRFWESKFKAISPVQRNGGRRYYRKSDMKLIGGIKFLLHEQGMTIKAVQRLLEKEGTAHVQSFSPETNTLDVSNISKKYQPKIEFSNSVDPIELLNNFNTDESARSKSVFQGEHLEHNNQPFLFPELELEKGSSEATAAHITALPSETANVAQSSNPLTLAEDILKTDPNLETFVGRTGPITSILKLSDLKQRQISQENSNIIMQLQHLHKKLSA